MGHLIDMGMLDLRACFNALTLWLGHREYHWQGEASIAMGKWCKDQQVNGLIGTFTEIKVNKDCEKGEWK